MLGNAYILPEDIIYILHTCDIFAAYKKTKYSLCISQMYKFKFFCYIASYILLVYIFIHIHTFVCIYIYVYTYILYITYRNLHFRKY